MAERKFVVVHDPHAKKPYGFNWAGWLETGDGVASQTWTAEPSGLTLSGQAINGTETTVWIDGGVAGTDYVVHDDIVTDNGIEDRRSFVVLCRDR